MNIIDCDKVKQYIALLNRLDTEFSVKVAKLFEMGVSDFDIQYDIAQCVEYICNAPFDNIMNENMPDDKVGKKLHINGITKQIFKYVKSTLNYGRAKIDSSNILSECAGIIHAIEEGTASQRQVNKAFYNVFVDVDSEKKGKERNAIGSMPDFKLLALCVLFTLIFASIAAKIANKADAKVLNRVVGVMLLILGVLMIYVKLF